MMSIFCFFFLVHKFLPSSELSKTIVDLTDRICKGSNFSKMLCQSDKSFSTVNCCVLSFWYLDQSLLTGFSGKTTLTVVKHTFIWNQSTKNMVKTWPISFSARAKPGVKPSRLGQNQE